MTTETVEYAETASFAALRHQQNLDNRQQFIERLDAEAEALTRQGPALAARLAELEREIAAVRKQQHVVANQQFVLTIDRDEQLRHATAACRRSAPAVLRRLDAAIAKAEGELARRRFFVHEDVRVRNEAGDLVLDPATGRPQRSNVSNAPAIALARERLQQARQRLDALYLVPWGEAIAQASTVASEAGISGLDVED